MGLLPRLLEEVLSGTHPGWGWGKRETSSPDSLALVGGAPISDTQVSPSEQRLRAGNRDFLMPTKMEGVRGTQATPVSATLTPGSSFSRKEEVNELTSKAKVTQECGGLGWGAAWGQFGVPDLWDLLPISGQLQGPSSWQRSVSVQRCPGKLAHTQRGYCFMCEYNP